MIVLFGIAGSGKSLQGKLLADKLGYRWISTGEFLRTYAEPEKHHQMIEGKLLNDEQVIAILDDVLKKLAKTEEAVLDGFPRTQNQANWLLEQNKEGHIKLTGVVNLTADKDLVKQRLLTRARPDDNEEAIKNRFLEFEQTTLPIIESFKKSGVPVHDIDASQTVDEVHKTILAALKVLK
jgi:adenylate kinase